MTEAMSRHEIEDVLTSIRRLVSHEGQAPSPTPSGPAKLVLTSALRVDAAEGAVPATEDSPDHAVMDDAMDDRSAPEADLSDGAPAEIPLPDAARVEVHDAATAPQMRDGAPKAQGRPSLLERIALAGQMSDQGSGTLSLSLQSPPTLAPAVDQHGPTLEAAVTDTALEATLARLEEALAITPPPSDIASDTIIDEAALSQIVAKIVRQELQGELGERITRNIRKLVRAEVARELQMRNL